MKSLVVAFALAISAGPALGQAGNAGQTVTKYGARLTDVPTPENLNARRVNNRVNSRLNTRLSLRIERFRTGATEDPTAAYRVSRDDGARTAPIHAPLPEPDGAR